MRIILFITSLIFCNSVFSQYQTSFEDNEVNLSYTVEKISNKEINIPLYNVKSNGINIPIFLTYDNSGFKPSDVPNSVGFGWSLQAGGSVEKAINHRIDESFYGWNTNADIESVLGDETDKFLLLDTEPDINYMNISNGDFMEYFYERRVTDVGVLRTPFIRSGFNNFHITESYNYIVNAENLIPVAGGTYIIGGGYNNHHVYTEEQAYSIENIPYINDDDSDLYFRKDNGIVYSFRKGIKRFSRYAQNPGMYENYYLHKVYKSNYDSNVKPINFEYIDTSVKKINLYGNGRIVKTNSDPMTPPEPSDPNQVGIELTGAVTDVSRKEISKIKTDNEIIEFKYSTENYANTMNQGVDSDYVVPFLNQSINLLEEINIYNNNGKFVFGYKFHYSNEQTSARDLFLKSIEKISKNKVPKLYKEFEYNFEGNNPLTQGRPIVGRTLYNGSDALGFLNTFGVNNDENVTPLFLDGQIVDHKLPNEDYLKANMLKSITNGHL